MKGLLVLGFFGILVGSISLSAQTNTVTNSDLERFRESRLQAEREYRENYARLGMPSPEELAKKRDEDISRIVEMGERLRRERLDREMRQAEFAAVNAVSESQTLNILPVVVRDGQSYFVGAGSFYRGSQRWQGWRGSKQPIYWRAAGGMVYWEPGGRPSSIWSSPYQPRLSRLQGPTRQQLPFSIKK
jgi:hypothetical protein